MEAKLEWKGNLRFDGIPTSGHVIHFDTVEDAGGSSAAASPMEHLLLAIGACSAMDVIAILKKMRQEVTEYTVQLAGERRDNHPRAFASVVIEHHIKGKNLDPAAVERAVQLSDEVYCSATACIREKIPVTARYVIEEA